MNHNKFRYQSTCPQNEREQTEPTDKKAKEICSVSAQLFNSDLIIRPSE